MTKEQIIQVCQKYEQILIDNEKTKEFSDKNGELSHIKWMVTEIPKYIKEDRMEKVHRWLGFVQGVLWCNEIMSIREMKNDNR